MSYENIKPLDQSIQAEVNRDETQLDWSAEAKAMESIAKEYEDKHTQVLPEPQEKSDQEEIDLLKGDGQPGYDIPVEKAKGADKKGEGSKGGVVIGHTKSGKPIYDSHDHSGHAEYEKGDHTQAMIKHLITLKNIEKNPATKESSAAYKHHKKQFNLHANSSLTLDKDDKKEGKDKEKKKERAKKSFEDDLDTLRKSKYIKREGGKGKYKYTYKEGQKMKEKPEPGHGHEDGPLFMTDLHGNEMMNFAAVEKRARSMDDAALRFSIGDAKEAMAANPEGSKSGYYADEVHVYAGELRRREMIREDPKAKSKRIASTILSQLGGNKFVAMTGAGTFSHDNGILSMRFPRTPEHGYKALNVKLMSNDLYEMTFFKIGNAPKFKVENKVISGVYNDQLQDVFEKETGLLTSLGTMGKSSFDEDLDILKGCPGDKIRSDGKGRGLGVGKGRGPDRQSRKKRGEADQLAQEFSNFEDKKDVQRDIESKIKSPPLSEMKEKIKRQKELEDKKGK